MGTDPWSLKTPGGPGTEEEPEGDSEGMMMKQGKNKRSTGNMGAEKGLQREDRVSCPECTPGLRMTRADHTCI